LRRFRSEQLRQHALASCNHPVPGPQISRLEFSKAGRNIVGFEVLTLGL
jgi:hypothetical protein